MDLLEKLTTLGEEARYDLACGACGTHAHRQKDDLKRWIYPAALPDGKRVALLKVLQTNACENECYYCATRRSSDVRRLAFSPDELACAFDEMARKGQAEGLFLSSGIAGSPTRSMDRMLATAELVRRKYAFQGYLHLKLLPGASRAHVERAMQLATRVSVNMEAPRPEQLGVIAPQKDFLKEILSLIQWAHEIRVGSMNRLAPAGQTTQFVAGAAGESDADLLRTTDWLYRRYGLARVYYSAFQPVPGTPLSDRPATPPLREHRLYQSDFLLRKYGFSFSELPFDHNGFLSLAEDPKTMWANLHPERFPVEINRASKEELLRVPGIGPGSAAHILQIRRNTKLRALEDLRRLGADARRAAPYVLLSGKRPPYQLPLQMPLEEMSLGIPVALPALAPV